MIIRKANDNDVERLYEMLYQVQSLHAAGRPDVFKAGTHKYSKEEIKGFLSNELSPVFVADFGDGVAVGYAFCDIREQAETSNLKKTKTYYLDDLCVDENYRGKGIGRKLYEYVLSQAESVGADSLTLNVWHLNESAVRFYEKVGMSPLKTTMEKVVKRN